MKRILLSVVGVAALALGGMFTNTAEAHGPYCRPYNNYGYGGGYRIYSGYTPYNVYSQPYILPYGAGYAGGWQPYQGLSIRRPGFGLQIGF